MVYGGSTAYQLFSAEKNDALTAPFSPLQRNNYISCSHVARCRWGGESLTRNFFKSGQDLDIFVDQEGKKRTHVHGVNLKDPENVRQHSSSIQHHIIATYHKHVLTTMQYNLLPPMLCLHLNYSTALHPHGSLEPPSSQAHEALYHRAVLMTGWAGSCRSRGRPVTRARGQSGRPRLAGHWSGSASQCAPGGRPLAGEGWYSHPPPGSTSQHNTGVQ